MTAHELEIGLTIFAILMVLYGAIGVWLGKRSITMPIVFVIIGIVIGPHGLAFLPIELENESVKLLAEVTLALLLFADASTLDFNALRHDKALPVRLLGVGLPLTMLLGGIVAFFLFPDRDWGFAFLVAAILAPTDAALGLPIFTNLNVPVRIRRVLNVESGLNDGIATPFVTLFIALTIAEEGVLPISTWFVDALTQIGLALLVGIVVGSMGGKFLLLAQQRQWTAGGPLKFAVLALAFLAYLGSLSLGGNGFVAAFVAGIAFGAVTRTQLSKSVDYTEESGTLLSLLVWSIFGSALAIPALTDRFDWRAVGYALLSLTLIRMAPMALALVGVHFRRDTAVLMGWFGPRGLASIVFGILAVNDLTEAGIDASLLASVVTWTILLSVLAHGLSAQPLAVRYAQRLKTAPADAPEWMDVPEVHVRSDVLSSATHISPKK